MNDELKLKLSKVLSLIESGATEGEKAAARDAFDRIIKRYDLDGVSITTLLAKEYYFPYRTLLDTMLLRRIVEVLADIKVTNELATRGYFGSGNKTVRAVRIRGISYEQSVIICCAYEYFKRHMAAQYAKYVSPELQKCRKEATRKKKKEKLDGIFFSKYVIASKLYKDGELTTNRVCSSELEFHYRMRDIKGGSYKTQLHGNNLLEQ